MNFNCKNMHIPHCERRGKTQFRFSQRFSQQKIAKTKQQNAHQFHLLISSKLPSISFSLIHMHCVPLCFFVDLPFWERIFCLFFCMNIFRSVRLQKHPQIAWHKLFIWFSYSRQQQPKTAELEWEINSGKTVLFTLSVRNFGTNLSIEYLHSVHSYIFLYFFYWCSSWFVVAAEWNQFSWKKRQFPCDIDTIVYDFSHFISFLVFSSLL